MAHSRSSLDGQCVTVCVGDVTRREHSWVAMMMQQVNFYAWILRNQLMQCMDRCIYMLYLLPAS